MPQGHRAAGGQNAKCIRQVATGRQGDDIRFPQPHFQIERSACGIHEFENPQARAGEGVHPKNAQVVARLVRQGGYAFDKRRGRTDARSLGNQRKDLLWQIAPDFQIGPTGDETDSILETRQGAAICHLN